MKKRRRYFDSIYTKVYVGEKSVNIHFNKGEREKAITLARAVLQAIESDQSIDIAAYYTKLNKEEKSQVTVTGL